jgi:hypothetical protein
MLIDEARIAARLNHPNVVQTIEIGGNRSIAPIREVGPAAVSSPRGACGVYARASSPGRLRRGDRRNRDDADRRRQLCRVEARTRGGPELRRQLEVSLLGPVREYA